jgi:hypothetical protein
MTHDTFDGLVTSYLTDADAIEVQALQQMRLAPRVAGDAGCGRSSASTWTRPPSANNW